MDEFYLRGEAGGNEYAWWMIGDGQGMLLLHGFTGSKANWNELGSSLSDRRRVLAVDLPGHGNSSAPAEVEQYTMPIVCRDLAVMLDQLHIAAVDLVGYSMGGRLALFFALHYPERVRSLVLESASPGLEGEAERSQRRDADNTLADRIELSGVATFVDEWEKLPLFASQARVEDARRQELRMQRLSNRAQGLANSLRGMGSGVQPSLWERLGELSVLVMLVIGELDEKFVAINQRMVASIHNVRIEVVPQAGHAVHFEQPEVYAALLREFIGTQVGARQ